MKELENLELFENLIQYYESQNNEEEVNLL